MTCGSTDGVVRLDPQNAKSSEFLRQLGDLQRHPIKKLGRVEVAEHTRRRCEFAGAKFNDESTIETRCVGASSG